MVTFSFISTLSTQSGNIPPKISFLGPDPSVQEGQIVTKDMIITDADALPGPLVITADVGLVGLVSGNLYRWTYKGDFAHDGITNVIAVSDGQDQVTDSFLLTVLNVNDPPVIAASGASIVVEEGNNLTITGTWSDPDVGDTVTLSVDIGFIIKTGGGTWSWSITDPAVAFNPNDVTIALNNVTVTVTADDGILQDSAQFTLFVNVVANQAPSVSAAQASVNQTAGITAINNGFWDDVDGDTVTLTADVGVVVKNGDGSWDWSLVSPVVGDTGLVTITADDATETTDAVFQLTITAASVVDMFIDNLHVNTSDANAGDDANFPKETIHAAIDGAPDGASDSVRTIIQVEGGSGQQYSAFVIAPLNAGQVIIDNRQNITLQGANAPKLDGLITPVGKKSNPASAIFTATLGLLEVKNSKNINVEGFDILNSQQCGITVRNTGEGLECENVQLIGNRITKSRAHGILFTTNQHHAAETQGIRGQNFKVLWNELVDNCTAVNEPTDLPGGINTNNSVGTAAGESCTSKRMNDCEFAYNLVREHNKEGLDFNNMTGGSIHHNEIRDRHTSEINNVPGPGQTAYGVGTGSGIYIDGAAEGVINVDIFSNVVSGDSIGIAIGSESGGDNDNIRVFSNICFNNNTVQIAFTGSSGAGPTPGTSTDVKVWFNTMEADSPVHNLLKINQRISDLSGLEIIGNILSRPVANKSSLQMITSQDGNNPAGFAGVLYRDNLFWSGGLVINGQYDGVDPIFGDPIYESFTAVGLQWPDAAPPTNMVGQPPRLSVPYLINSSSPAIGVVNTTPAVLDIVGLTRPTSNSDAGAFEQITVPSGITTDPLRQLASHPSPALSDWLTPVNAVWVDTASTWVSSVTTGYDGGVLAGPQQTAIRTDVTVGVLNSGSYTARIRAHIPDVDTSLRMRLIRNTTEEVADFSWTGPHTTGDFASPAEFNSESFPVTMLIGDKLELELFTESYDSGAGQLRTVLTDAQKVLVVSMDLERDPIAAADPGTGTLFYWEADPDAGVFTGPTKAVYDVDYDALPVDGPTGRKVGDQSTGPAVGVGFFTFPINFEIPTMSADGKLECFNKTDAHDGHCMLRARMSNDPTFVESSSYLRGGGGQEYEIEIKVDIQGRVDPIAEGRTVSNFGILWQGHSGNYPPGWSGNPQITIQLDGGTNEWILWVRGETAVSPELEALKNYHSTIRYVISDWWSGVQTFRIQYKPAYTGNQTYVKLWHNGGDPVIDEVGMPIGLNWSGLGGQGNQSMQHTFGEYGFRGLDVPNSRPDIDILKFQIRTLS